MCVSGGGIYNLISHSTIKLASPNGTKATQLLMSIGMYVGRINDNKHYILKEFQVMQTLSFNQIKNVLCCQLDLCWKKRLEASDRKQTKFEFLISQQPSQDSKPSSSAFVVNVRAYHSGRATERWQGWGWWERSGNNSPAWAPSQGTIYSNAHLKGFWSRSYIYDANVAFLFK